MCAKALNITTGIVSSAYPKIIMMLTPEIFHWIFAEDHTVDNEMLEHSRRRKESFAFACYSKTSSENSYEQ